MKYLCVCDGGNVRSQALAYVLHDLRGQEAIAVGRLRVSPESMKHFCRWADKIVLMMPHMIESIDKKYHKKTLCFNVGDDRWGIYIHPELLQIAHQGADWLESLVENIKQ